MKPEDGIGPVELKQGDTFDNDLLVAVDEGQDRDCCNERLQRKADRWGG